MMKNSPSESNTYSYTSLSVLNRKKKSHRNLAAIEQYFDFITGTYHII